MPRGSAHAILTFAAAIAGCGATPSDGEAAGGAGGRRDDGGGAATAGADAGHGEAGSAAGSGAEGGQGVGGQGMGGQGMGGSGGTPQDGGSGAGPESGAGGHAGAGATTGDPIDAPPETWTWVPFADAKCANGSSTGLGVNLTDASPNAMVFLMGGGACWDAVSCYQDDRAWFVESGFAEIEFTALAADAFLNTGIFDRAHPGNPFRDWSYVFVPYCTGDFHAGTRVADYAGIPTAHVGYHNMTSFLDRLVPTFASADRIALVGSSGGGYGVAFNWARAQERFGSVRVDMVDDSGPPISAPVAHAVLEQTWRDNWGMQAMTPADCSQCDTKFYGWVEYALDKYPGSRGALLSHTVDATLGSYFALGPAQMAQGHAQLASELFDTHANAHYFYVGDDAHGFLNNPHGIALGTQTAMSWIAQMVSDDPSWTSLP